jgi:hypothetical protein
MCLFKCNPAPLHSGYCTSGANDVIHCDTSWIDKWESFKVSC